MRVDMFLWPRIIAEFHWVLSQTGRISATKNGISLHLDDASACKTAFSMSSCSYSGMAMQELVHRN